MSNVPETNPKYCPNSENNPIIGIKKIKKPLFLLILKSKIITNKKT